MTKTKELYLKAVEYVVKNNDWTKTGTFDAQQELVVQKYTELLLEEITEVLQIFDSKGIPREQCANLLKRYFK